MAATPFFLAREQGQRFCLAHAPAGRCRGALLYLHPFAEEMNKTRRMAALQARALAEAGYAVLQLDLAGCGDSSGDFADASWDGWLADVAAGRQWLEQQYDQPVTLWGLRTGALLALDYARTAARAPRRLLLWQPVLNGATFLTQFLRLRMANALLAEGRQGAAEDTQTLRATLQGGAPLEVAGYTLAPALAASLDGLDAIRLPAPACPVDWFELVAAADRPLPIPATRLAAAWREQGCPLTQQAIVGPSFWATQEISVSPALLAATSALFTGAAP
ncbi:hydrolase 2, exosortase A system-associated [Duganella callida]|uniref:Hydrolase 2, exosortase A system-associated n=2 Tax=Duganella callida TaxID=2561932 RepID=A0A4Y9SFW2_9BURK|nr:hydrolase 2, exosortase A system-associated [Duganella callida]